MRDPRRLFTLAARVVVALSVACAHLGIGSSGRLEEAKAAMARNEPATAYALLKEIEIRDPGSPEAAEAFPLAVHCFKVLYGRARYDDPTSPWVTVEPQFMFQWLGRYFDTGFPSEQAGMLFVGASYDLYRAFQQYAKTDPRLEPWKFAVEDDDGWVYAITAERTAADES